MTVDVDDGSVARPPAAIGSDLRLGLRGPGVSGVLERLGVGTPAAAAERVDDVDGLGENVRSTGDGEGLGELRGREGVLVDDEGVELGADIVESKQEWIGCRTGSLHLHYHLNRAHGTRYVTRPSSQVSAIRILF